MTAIPKSTKVDDLLGQVWSQQGGILPALDFLNAVFSFVNNRTLYLADDNGSKKVLQLVNKHIEDAKKLKVKKDQEQKEKQQRELEQAIVKEKEREQEKHKQQEKEQPQEPPKSKETSSTTTAAESHHAPSTVKHEDSKVEETQTESQPATNGDENAENKTD